MISQFPAFAPLREVSPKDILPITTVFEPYSDFNLTSLTAWDTDSSLSVSLLHGNLVVKMPDYTTGETVYSLIGDRQIDQTVHELFSLTDELKLVPQVVVDALEGASDIEVREDPDNFDYIYSLEELSTLPGGAFKKKRNKLHKAAQELGDMIQIAHVTSLSDEDKKQMLRVFDEWASLDEQGRLSPEAEKKALTTLLYEIDNEHLITTFVKSEDKVIAFSINEILDNHYAICHFEKAVSLHDQIYVLLANAAANALVEKGARFVNWEQDLGIAGLRAAKMSYHPTKFLQKYTITKK